MKFRSHRFPTEFPVRIKTSGGQQMGQVIDVNTEGAQIVGLVGIATGDKIQLDVLSLRIEAVVRWSTKNRVGVTFRPPISHYLVDTLRQRRGARQTGYRGRVGFGFMEMH